MDAAPFLKTCFLALRILNNSSYSPYHWHIIASQTICSQVQY